jgi:4'-phosphopantetheinyl transferase EntD
MDTPANSKPLTVTPLGDEIQFQEFLAWIQSFEKRLNREFLDAEPETKIQGPIALKARRVELNSNNQRLLELRSKIEARPEFFEMNGARAPDLDLFLARPKDWAEKTLPTLNRRTEWIAGRLAVFDCYEQTLLATSDLKKPLRFQYSLSHSDGHVLACGTRCHLGIGIDLERTSRVLSPAVLHRIFSAPEQNLGLKPIDLWVIKEATFKALHLQSPFTLPQINIQTAQEMIPSDQQISIKTGVSQGPVPALDSCLYWLEKTPGWTACVSISPSGSKIAPSHSKIEIR